MKAILLAAGFGSRLRPLTDTVPKCLVPIRGRALLDIWLESLSAAGIGPFLVNTHHLSDVVRRHVDQSPYRSQIMVVHEEHLLGTGGTLLANRAFFSGEPVLLAHADNLCACDFQGFVRAHEQRPAGTLITMMTFTTDNPQSCGILELDGRGIVVGFHEKVPNPPGNLANGAVYLIEPEVIDDIAALQKPTINFSTEVVPRFMGRINTWQNTGVHLDIGTLLSFQVAQSLGL